MACLTGLERLAPRARFAQACLRGADALRPTSPGSSAPFQPPPLPQTCLLPPGSGPPLGWRPAATMEEPEKATPALRRRKSVHAP